MPKNRAQWRALMRCLPGYDPWAMSAGSEFDEDAAESAIEFFQKDLTHVKGAKAGSRFLLQRWQRAVIGNLFGWKRPDGTRRYREAFIFVARKNGKTPLAAGIVLYGLLRDDEPCAEIYGAASEYKQASLVFEHARGMVNQNPSLKSRCKVFSGQGCRMIQLDLDYSTYRVISSDSFSAHGFNTHMGIIDELHTQPNRDLVDALITSTGARRQPLIVHITTSDFERESICNEKHKYACAVRDNGGNPRKAGYDPSFLPVIYEAGVDDDWHKPSTWRKANPNMGVSIPREFLARECKRAQETPTYENTFKRLHCNIRTEQDVRWIQMPTWDACGEAFEVSDLEGRACYGGLDLASTQDTTAFVLVFPIEDGSHYVLPYFWIPGDNARAKERKDKVPYLTWERDSRIVLTNGNGTDYGVLRHDIKELGKRFDIKEIAFDRWNAAYIVQQLQEEDGFHMVEFGQGFQSLSAPSKEFERLLLGGNLMHGGHPVLRWQATNVMVKIDPAGNIKPDKGKSTQKIDGIVGTIMALGRAMARSEKASHYNENELFVI